VTAHRWIPTPLVGQLSIRNARILNLLYLASGRVYIPPVTPLTSVAPLAARQAVTGGEDYNGNVKFV